MGDLTQFGPTTDADLSFLDPACSLLEHLSVNLTARQAQGVDLIGDLRALAEHPPRQRLDFYHRMHAAFAGFGDRHTRPDLPAELADRFSYLPFVVARCTPTGDLVVTGSISSKIEVGDRVRYWNGEQATRVLDDHMRQQLAGFAAARRAKAVQTLTVRPLALMPLAFGDVVIGLETPSGRSKEIKLAWQQTDARGLGVALGSLLAGSKGMVQTKTGLRVSTPQINGRGIGWIRVASLRVATDPFLSDLRTVLSDMPPNGVVLDLRGCEEGFIPTGEAMIGLFSDKPIDPLRFEFRITPWLRDLVARTPALQNWTAALSDPSAQEQGYSQALPVSDVAQVRAQTRAYFGPVVVLVDGLCFSTAEMVAAGFQDHEIAPVVGTAQATAGGGASPWSQALIHRLCQEDRFEPVTGAASLHLAVRRCRRGGRYQGQLIEAQGVQPDQVLPWTQRDALDTDRDLAEHLGRFF